MGENAIRPSPIFLWRCIKMKINKKAILAIGGALVALGGVVSLTNQCKKANERKHKLNKTRKQIAEAFRGKHAKKGFKIMNAHKHAIRKDSKKKDRDMTLSLSK